MDDLFTFAEDHHGLFRTSDALRMDLEVKDLRALTRGGRIVRVGYQIFRVTGSRPTPEQGLLTAVWAGGPAAVASHFAAAWLYRLPGFSPGPLDVLRPGNRSRKGAIGTLRQTTYLPEHHVQIVEGIPVTSPGRTAFDICGLLRPERALKVLTGFERLHLARTSDFRLVLAEAGARGRAGTATMRGLLQERDNEPVTESDAEDLCLAVLLAGNMPPVGRQRVVGGTCAPIGRFDFVVLGLPVVVEVDSRAFHDSWEVTLEDQRRDAKLRAAGWIIIRTNWHQLTYEPELFIAGLRGAVELARRAVTNSNF